jgi:D-beta-D-heptose 7-phosphate kinase / D-beta-D-heptose 1-phosphate adenosyltransferase
MAVAKLSYHAVVTHFPQLTVLVAGDFMLDRFVYGSAERLSPEAPVPVLSYVRDELMLGGAGNVVTNVAALGGRVIPVTVIGDDEAGAQLRCLLETRGIDHGQIISSPKRNTTRKTRFVAQHQLLRFDEEVVMAHPPADRAAMIAAFAAEVEKADIVILSDYGKGTLAGGAAAELIALCREAGRPVLVDPKGSDYSVYRGATAVTPNRKELGEATGMPTCSDAEVEAAGRLLRESYDLDFVLVTRSEEGMSVIEATRTLHMPTKAREVFDVSGAGDTVIATFALALAAGCETDVAAEIANAAAGIVVGKLGTAQTDPNELLASLGSESSEGTSDRDGVIRLAAAWRAEGLRVGFTNGCFDILHVGHIAQLEDAKAHCDRLIVGLNTDASVRHLKGEGRPVNTEDDRARLILALKVVDAVVLFDEETPLELIKAVAPDLLVKGADYTVDRVVGSDFVLARGGEVYLSPIVDGRSTTATLQKIVSLG